MSYLNATADYSIVSTWGYRDDQSGEWSGMVGQLVRNEAELGASPLFMTVDRVSIIQYIASPTPTGSRFIFRSPKLSYTDNVFVLPFDSLVWGCLIGLVLVTTIFLIVSIFIEWKYVVVEVNHSHINFLLQMDTKTNLVERKRATIFFAEKCGKPSEDRRFSIHCVRSHMPTGHTLGAEMHSSTNYNGGRIHNPNVFVHQLFGKYCRTLTIAIHPYQNTAGFV